MRARRPSAWPRSSAGTSTSDEWSPRSTPASIASARAEPTRPHAADRSVVGPRLPSIGAGRRAAAALTVVALAFGGCASRSSAEPPPSSRTILWRIVSQCLDPSVAGYCATCPSPIGGACSADTICTRTTEVWAETPTFVAIRDIKMCGCPEGFVHGLALPRARVFGIEDERRPSGIWPFAWAAATSRIAEPTSIALVVNPPDERTQDQLHVHLVRLAPDARRRLAARSPGRTAALDPVWHGAA